MTVKCKSLTILFVTVLVLLASCVANDVAGPKKNSKHVPFLKVNLHDLGYQSEQEYRYPGTGIPRDVSILYDDSKKRLAFIDDNVLAVYFSHLLPPPKNGGLTASRNMEAFFVDPSGSLISRKTWVTSKRKWLNERWDTQARILPVNEGFLVHAGSSLTLYSADQQEKARISLEDDFSWAATVAPLGRTVHLQRITSDNNSEGAWLASDTLNKISTQREVAGITSASDTAVVTKLAHCVQLQASGEPPRNLCCHDPCRLGLPEFLSSTEILAVYPNGFKVLSDHAEELWGREVASKTRIIAACERSLDGSHFAILLSTDHNVVFDHVNIAKGQPTILVYDRSGRKSIFALTLGSAAEQFTFCISPNGSVLAVLDGDAIRLYRVPLVSTS